MKLKLELIPLPEPKPEQKLTPEFFAPENFPNALKWFSKKGYLVDLDFNSREWSCTIRWPCYNQKHPLYAAMARLHSRGQAKDPYNAFVRAFNLWNARQKEYAKFLADNPHLVAGEPKRPPLSIVRNEAKKPKRKTRAKRLIS